MARKRFTNELWNTTFTEPAATANGTVTPIFTIQAGYRVIAASARVKQAAATTTNTTLEFGDGVDPDGYITAYDTETNAAGTLIDGVGALLANAGGKLYLVADTLDMRYVNGGTPGAVDPIVEIRVTVRKEW